jgi:nucleoside-diphosphate-sugar epimerase
MRSVGDYSKAEKLLGWTPSLTLEQSLQDTVEYMRQQPENI